MIKFNREEGLTLIELLITIAVIAIVAAISVPVISNVVGSSRTNAATSMQEQANSFIDKYLDSGQVTYDSVTQTFEGFVDLNGDGSYVAADELIEKLVVGTEFTVSDLVPDATTSVLPALSVSVIVSSGA